MAKGHDTIGSGKPHGLKGDVKVSNTPGRMHFDRANTVDGKDKTVPVVKGAGADLVAKTIGKERDQTATGMKFRIGENMAKRVDYDAPPG